MASTGIAGGTIRAILRMMPFAPRLGFAYRLTDKTVVRGGYGMFFDSSETREIDNSGDLYPFVIRANLTPTVDPTLPKTTNNLFVPASALQPVAVGANGGTTFPAGGQFVAVIISENPRNPYVQQWSASVQRELARNTTLEVNYVGNKGTHLLDRVNVNQPFPVADPAFCQANPTLRRLPGKRAKAAPELHQWNRNTGQPLDRLFELQRGERPAGAAFH